ncbi:MAG TPA: hypothetical protein VK731_10495, partial [Candidatus Cybelea sp.]|nr:hypothetical protein [Candidatus Cybelea sp.]
QRDSGLHKLNTGWTKVAGMQSRSTPELPPALVGMMASLPLADAGWTKEKRGQFLKLFETALDWCIPILTEREMQAAQEAKETK